MFWGRKLPGEAWGGFGGKETKRKKGCSKRWVMTKKFKSAVRMPLMDTLPGEETLMHPLLPSSSSSLSPSLSRHSQSQPLATFFAKMPSQAISPKENKICTMPAADQVAAASEEIRNAEKRKALPLFFTDFGF